MQKRETERLEANINTFFFKVTNNEGMIACMRARMVPESTEDAVVMVPPKPGGCAIGAHAWETCCRQMAEKKQNCFGNRKHICK
jgi:hypothetical protein